MSKLPDSDELDALRDECLDNLFGRTGLSLDRIEISELGYESSDTLSLSLVSSKVDGPYRKKGGGNEPIVVEGTDIRLTRVEDGRRRLMIATDRYDQRDWIEKRFREVRAALTSMPDFVCFPEFAFPPPRSFRNEDGYISRQDYARPFFEYEQRLRAELEYQGERSGAEIEPFIVAGSYHCPEDFYNVAVLFPQGANKRLKVVVRKVDYSLERGRERQDLHTFISAPISHRKRYPARKAGEICRVPSEMKFYTYNFRACKTAVLICSDIVDLNQFMHLVTINTAKNSLEPIDIVLVPAYNVSEIHKSMCRELSFMAATTVAFVNANGELGGVFPKTELFCCGYDLDGLKSLLGKNAVSTGLKKVGEAEVLSVTLSRLAINNLRQHFRHQAARGSTSTRVSDII